MRFLIFYLSTHKNAFFLALLILKDAKAITNFTTKGLQTNMTINVIGAINYYFVIGDTFVSKIYVVKFLVFLAPPFNFSVFLNIFNGLRKHKLSKSSSSCTIKKKILLSYCCFPHPKSFSTIVFVPSTIVFLFYNTEEGRSPL